MTKTPRNRAAQDATLINVRPMKKHLAFLKMEVTQLRRQFRWLEKRLEKLGG